MVDHVVDTRELEPGISWDIGPSKHLPPHVMFLHARYVKEFYDRLFPNDTVYITSIRQPSKWFISYVDFMPLFR